MKTICLMNLKGGVAKTASTINMAAILASDHQKRVLVIDADSQGNSTEFFDGDPAKGNMALLLRAAGMTDWSGYGLIQASNFPGVDILCGSDELMDLDLTAVAQNDAMAHALADLRDSLAERDAYDYILIDCPPAFNAASAAALLAADDVIIPIKLDAFSLRGLVNLHRQVANMQTLNPNLRIAGCLRTMWYASATLQGADKTLENSGLPIFATKIRRSSKVDDMTFSQQPLAVFSPRSGAGVDYRRFVKEYLEVTT